MVKVYPNGNDFYEENSSFLLENKYTEPFFRFDSPLLTEAGKEEYAIRIQKGSACLLAMLVEPYNILLYGEKALAGELVNFLTSNGYRIKDYLCSIEMGDELIRYFGKEGYEFRLSLGMDFMEATQKTAPTSEKIELAGKGDVDELYEMTCCFIRDCGLSDVAKKDRIQQTLKDYRILRKDGKIASFAKIHEWSDADTKISTVYTRDEFRNQGCGRAVVGSVVNEIIDSGRIAALNVDQKNPISNHLYSSLGFRKIFSQGVYALNTEE